MGKIFRISLKLNFTPKYFGLLWVNRIESKADQMKRGPFSKPKSLDADPIPVRLRIQFF